MLGAALFLSGALALLVWRGTCREPVLFWFGITALGASASAFLLLWPPQVAHGGIKQLLLFTMQHVYITPLLVLCLRVGEAYQPWLERILWFVFAAGAATAALLSFERYPLLATGASAAYLALAIAFLAWLLRASFRRRRWTSYLLGAALAAPIAFEGHDWGRWMGHVDFDDLLLGSYAAAVLALGATVVERHVQAERALEDANRELEQRVADKTRMIERTYERIRQAEREQAVLPERERIMADMHDSLGASLVSLIGAVQSGKTDVKEIETRLEDALTELRAIVDSLGAVEGDLGVVLGNIRYRMRAAIEDSGARLSWQVEPLPTLADLTPDKVLAIQRIVLEALTNALRHASARVVTVSAHLSEDHDAIAVTIADDGRGFDPSMTGGGRGLRNMRNRAASIGARIEAQSVPGGGTQVTLVIPLKSAPLPDPDAARGPVSEPGPSQFRAERHATSGTYGIAASLRNSG